MSKLHYSISLLGLISFSAFSMNQEIQNLSHYIIGKEDDRLHPFLNNEESAHKKLPVLEPEPCFDSKDLFLKVYEESKQSDQMNSDDSSVSDSSPENTTPPKRRWHRANIKYRHINTVHLKKLFESYEFFGMSYGCNICRYTRPYKNGDSILNHFYTEHVLGGNPNANNTCFLCNKKINQNHNGAGLRAHLKMHSRAEKSGYLNKYPDFLIRIYQDKENQ